MKSIAEQINRHYAVTLELYRQAGYMQRVQMYALTSAQIEAQRNMAHWMKRAGKISTKEFKEIDALLQEWKAEVKRCGD